MNFLTFIIICLASYRVTHVIVFDKVFEPVRNLFVTRTYRSYESGLTVLYELQGGIFRRIIGQIMNCFWCSGIWVSAVIVAAYILAPETMMWVYSALAAAAVLSLIETVWVKAVGFPEEMIEVKTYATINEYKGGASNEVPNA